MNSARPLPTGKNKPRACVACHQRVAAWTTPRVDYCYQCLPGGPFEPPPCQRCGGTRKTTGYEYYCQGLCERCHIAAPQRVDACRDCLAWGVIRKHQWLCWRCHSWRTRFPRGTCRICRRTDLPVNPDQACSLCDRQMVIRLGLTLEEANAGGQQLYLANVAWQPTRVRPGKVRRNDPPRPEASRQRRPKPVEFCPLDQTQPTLFEVPHDVMAAQAKRLLDAHQLPDPPHEQMAAYLEAAVLDHARRHGWPKSTIYRHVLPASGNPRSTMGAGLRSILTVLKARKILFVNPIARISTGGHEHRTPLPAHADKIREALLSPNSACAALTALATFHGLRAGELRNLHLTDLSDDRLHLATRNILLAEPVKVRLTAWLDHRNKRWPNSANPHVFINLKNANRTTPIGGRWLTLATGIPIHILREDRILHEARVTGGDVRRICDLFGLSVEGALRYLPDPELDSPGGPSS